MTEGPGGVSPRGADWGDLSPSFTDSEKSESPVGSLPSSPIDPAEVAHAQRVADSSLGNAALTPGQSFELKANRLFSALEKENLVSDRDDLMKNLKSVITHIEKEREKGPLKAQKISRGTEINGIKIPLGVSVDNKGGVYISLPAKVSMGSYDTGLCIARVLGQGTAKRAKQVLSYDLEAVTVKTVEKSKRKVEYAEAKQLEILSKLPASEDFSIDFSKRYQKLYKGKLQQVIDGSGIVKQQMFLQKASGDLKKCLGEMTAEQKTDVMGQVIENLKFLHDNGITHGDLRVNKFL